MQLSLLILCFIQFFSLFVCEDLYLGPFTSSHWSFDNEADFGTNWVRFTVALKLHNKPAMKQHFQAVSDPRSASYGKYLSREELDKMYGPKPEEKLAVKKFFEQIPDSKVHLHEHGDLMEVLAPIHDVETHLKTELGLVSHNWNLIPQKSIRARTHLQIPDEITEYISFISLNAPVNHVKPRAAKSLKQQQAPELVENTTIGIVPGNEDALIQFIPYCADGSINNYNPPCTNFVDQPSFSVSVNTYTNTANDPYVLNTDPTVFTISYTDVYCYDNSTKPCSGSTRHGLCYCLTKVKKKNILVRSSLILYLFYYLVITITKIYSITS
jgi:hypothetical protein